MSKSEPSLSDAIRERLQQSKRVRRNVSGDGRLRIDRPLPFLTVYRYPTDRGDHGTVEMVTTEAAYMFASGAEQHADAVLSIIETVRDHSLQQFGAFLLVEVWSESLLDNTDATLTHPVFEIRSQSHDELRPTVTALTNALSEIDIASRVATVVANAEDVQPPGMKSLASMIATDKRCHLVGVAVHPIFRDTTGETLYPLVLQSLRRQFGVALRKAFFQFTKDSTEQSPKSVNTLGPSTFVQAATLVDQQLCDISESFDYLLQITPTNGNQAWDEFRESGYKQAPKFQYRPLPRKPTDLKQSLYEVPIERIEDATLAEWFLEKQDELDRQITSLVDIGTPAFIFGGLQLYGDVEADLFELANSILRKVSPSQTGTEAEGATLSGKDLARMAQQEIGRYRELDENFNASVELRDDIAAGIMVSKNRLFVSPTVKVREKRAEALMHHEIGTHVLTYFNGQGQPFQQLYAGLAGYEAMQEGLAVIGEFLTDGLTHSRLRKLAARVVAVKSLIDGADFSDTFALLVDEHGYSPRVAFLVTMRVYRGGGSTKDAIYLRGLKDVLDYLARGEKLEKLFIGKFAISHLPAIDEFRHRNVIKPPRLLPRYLSEHHVRQRLAQCPGKSVLDLIGT